MIDIHSHIIPFVDDGSRSMEASLNMLKAAEEQGVTKIVCTPHYRYGMFETDKQTVIENFELLKAEAANAGVSVKLYLGQEIHYNKNICKELSEGFYFTMNDTKYALVEFPFDRKSEITDAVYNLVHAGFKPIVAHYERYAFSSVDEAYEIRALGGDLQINAFSLVGEYGGEIKKLALKLLKNDLADYVAGDIHASRRYQMEAAAKIVKKKFGEERFERLFVTNAERFL